MGSEIWKPDLLKLGQECPDFEKVRLSKSGYPIFEWSDIRFPKCSGDLKSGPLVWILNDQKEAGLQMVQIFIE